MQPQFASSRPIPGAVATQGLTVRQVFVRKTYAHLAGAIGLFVALSYSLLHSELGMAWNAMALGNWMIVMVLFMGAGYMANKFAYSETSRKMQYFGLGLYVVAEAFIMLPLMTIADAYSAAYGGPNLLGQAAVITLVLFGGLTATVFITKKDFSFMGRALSLLTWGALAAILAGMLFGFTLGTFFALAMVALAGGYVLYYTSKVLAHMHPNYYVGAALALFSAIALMFYYILYFLIASRD